MVSAVGVEPIALTNTAVDEVTLRDLREYAGLTHQQLADRIGYSAACSYTNGQTLPPRRRFSLLHRLYSPAPTSLVSYKTSST